MFDDEDDETDMYDEEQEENEISADSAPPAQSNVRPIRSMAQSKKKRQLRVRPMTPAMAEKHPEVVSIIMTRADGRQLMFVR